MRHFCIIANTDKDKDLELSHAMEAEIIKRGGTCRIVERDSQCGDILSLFSEKDKEEIDAMFVLGGDGTMLRTARDLRNFKIPMIGVNLGNLGYLCELDRQNVFDAIELLFRDAYMTEDRMMLTGGKGKHFGETPTHPALNDIVICRDSGMQVICLNLYVDDRFLCRYDCDGLIIATPTGSTAYSLSAGGPILDPQADMIVITPINAQVLTAKSSIEVVRRNTHGTPPLVAAAFDGDELCKLQPGERMYIRRADDRTTVLKLSQTSFIETLRRKLDAYHV